MKAENVLCIQNQPKPLLTAPAICRMEILFLMQTLLLSCFINIYCLELLNYVTDDRSKFSSRRLYFFGLKKGLGLIEKWDEAISARHRRFHRSIRSATL